MEREEHSRAVERAPNAARPGAPIAAPAARVHAEVLARRLTRSLGLDDKNPGAVLENAAHPAAPALHALAALARRLHARSVDAVLTPELLVVSIATDAPVPASGRVFELAHAAFQRPLSLHAGKAVALTPPDGAQPALRAAAATARAYLARMRAMESEALRDEDPEGAHELRVAARRARTAVRLLAAVDRDARRAPAWKDLHDVVRTAATLAGTVRDRDVFLEALRGSLPLRTATREAAVQFIEGDRRKHYARMARLLRGATHAKGMARCDAALRDVLEHAGPGPDAAAGAAGLSTGGSREDLAKTPALDDSARGFTDKQLRALRKRFEADLTHAEGLHDVRRSMRRVRDVVELFGPSLRESQRALRRRMQPVQSVLGALNDVYVAESLLPPPAGRAAGWVDELRGVLETRRREIEVRLAVPLAVLAATIVQRW